MMPLTFAGIGEENIIRRVGGKPTSMKRFQTVFPAVGGSNSAIELTIPELEKYSNYKEWVEVSKPIE